MPRRFQLTPQRLHIHAPLPLIWQILASTGRGQLPRSKNTARLIERKSDNILIVEFSTHSPKKTYTTLEEMTLHPPDRITFRHLTGPLPYVWEEMKLEAQRESQTALLYRGEFSTRSPIGFLLAPLYIRPLFDKLALQHLKEIKHAAESLANFQQNRKRK